MEASPVVAKIDLCVVAASEPAGAFTKLYLADKSGKFHSGTLLDTTEYAMTLAPLLDASSAIQLYAILAIP
jgi:hypothetical protein